VIFILLKQARHILFKWLQRVQKQSKIMRALLFKTFMYRKQELSENCHTRHVWEEYIENAEDIRLSPEGKETYTMRGQTIERVFANAKEKHFMRYTHLRGLARLRMQVLLTFAAMNLKKLAKWKKKNRLIHEFSTFLTSFELNMLFLPEFV